MKKQVTSLVIMLLLMMAQTLTAQVQQRRPIDNRCG